MVASAPSSPAGPCGPVAPVAPVSPCGPCAPVAPVSPCGPVAPRSARRPLRPYEVRRARARRARDGEHRAVPAVRAGDAVVAVGTGRAVSALRAGVPGVALRTLGSGGARLPFLALRPLWAGLARVALRALGDVGGRGAVLVCDRDGGALGGLRHGGRGRKAVRPVRAVVVTTRRCLLDRVGDGRGAVRRVLRCLGRLVCRVGRGGRDLGGMLVRVDGLDEQRESVLVLGAAHEHRLNADREHAGRDVGVVAARDHELRQHGALRLLHGRRVVNDVLSQRLVDLVHGLAPALAGCLVPPQEVDIGARQVSGRAALPHVQLQTAPRGVRRRGHQEVAQPLVGRVPYDRVKSVSVEHAAPLVM